MPRAGKGMSEAEYGAYRKGRGLPGGTRTAVRQALRDGRITRNEDGKIDPAEADLAWEENTDVVKRHPRRPAPDAEHEGTAAERPDADPRPGPEPKSEADPKPATYSEARAVREALNARIARLEYEERIGKLVSAAEVEREAFRKGRLLRDRLFAIPGRLGAQIAAESDPKAIAALLDREFRQVLDETLGEL